jgi:hypothetical protein
MRHRVLKILRFFSEAMRHRVLKILRFFQRHIEVGGGRIGGWGRSALYDAATYRTGGPRRFRLQAPHARRCLRTVRRLAPF